MSTSSRGEILNSNTAIAGVVLIVLVGVFVLVDPIAKWRKWQDMQRIERMREVQSGLEEFYNDFGRYPVSSSEYQIVDPATRRSVPWGSSWVPYVSALPKDPEKDKWFVYYSSPEAGNQTYGLYASFSFPFEDGVTCRVSEDGLCSALPSDALCGEDEICNSGVSSPNSSP